MAIDEGLADDAPLPTTKAELLDRVAGRWQSLQRAIEALSDEEVAAPGPDGWSVKDHLVHLATWEAGIGALLRREPRYAAMGVDEKTYLRGADAVNADVYAQTRDLALEDVRDLSRRTHDDLIATIDVLDDGDLRKTYSHYQPDEPGRETGAPIVRWVAGNTYEHYAEHEAWIASLVERAR